MAEIGQERVTTGSGLACLVTCPAGVCTSPSLCVPVSLEEQSRCGIVARELGLGSYKAWFCNLTNSVRIVGLPTDNVWSLAANQGSH